MQATTVSDSSQTITEQFLVDRHSKTDKIVPWHEKKYQALQIAKAYDHLSKTDPEFKAKAYKISRCGTLLEFRRYLEACELIEIGELRLDRANFCRLRGCPMCDWRRSLKIYGQTSQIMDKLEGLKYRFLFVTMSFRNCDGAQMRHEIKRLFRAFVKLLDRKKVKKQVKGAMRTLEVTHNLDIASDFYNTFNLHLHGIFVVKPSYFKGNNWIKQPEWQDIWKEVGKVAYDPHFHIKAVKPKDKGAIREVSKYSTKPNDILLIDDPHLMDEALFYIDQGLAHHRLISYYGIMKKIKADLNLDDAENGDLVNVDGQQELNENLKYVIERYGWHFGYNFYTKSIER